ncbi:MAG: hypothetical protein J2P17_29975 [Mycobacterium sp.]|nr:hypothetical protein [Mycobacterium sp.]
MSATGSGIVFGTKTEEQAHADWLRKAETSDEAEKMRAKIAEYERMRRPIHLSDCE